MSEIRTVAFKTLGCRLNQSETDAIEAKFRERSYTIVPFGERADLTVVNTCTVTNDADRKSRYAIRQAVRSSRRGRVVVTGCYAQMKPEEIRSMEGVDLVLGNDEKYKLFDYLENLGDGKLDEPLVFVGDHGDLERITADGFISAASRTRAFLKIQDGCDYYCSFCIIPFARGRARSRPFSETLEEARKLAERGYREIVLTGVNIGTYYDRASDKRLPDLLDKMQRIPGLDRIRISSIEPNTVTEGLLKVMSDSDIICPYLHIPIQSASDKILSAMRRKYRAARLEKLMEKIAKYLPDAGLGTDVIVGFPGETEEDFEETVRFIEDHPFSYLHIFPYSERSGTLSEKLPDPVDQKTKKRRLGVLREINRIIRKAYARKFFGKVLPVLFEEADRRGMHSGYTPNYIRVSVSSETDLRGKICDVKLAE